MIYADYSASAPLLPEAKEAMLNAMDQLYGNPSSIHGAGRRAASLIEGARRDIGEAFGLSPHEVFFTSGGTEANNMALFGAALKVGKDKKHIIAGASEHMSVLKPLEALNGRGFKTELIMPDNQGCVSRRKIEEALGSDCLLLSLMAANNECGAIQPIYEAGEICEAKGVLFHCDAVQAAGHIKLDMRRINADLISISAHKFGGPKGTGALLVRQGVKTEPIIYGGGQEMNRRSGTQNVAGIAGMAAALKASVECMKEEEARLSDLRDYFESGLEKMQCAVLGSKTPRLPGISLVRFFKHSGEHILLMLDLQDICVSAGAACSSGDKTGSHTAVAMGLSEKEAMQTVRFSFGKGSSVEDVDIILTALEKILE